MPSHTQRRRQSKTNAISFIMSARACVLRGPSKSKCGWWAPGPRGRRPRTRLGWLDHTSAKCAPGPHECCARWRTARPRLWWAPPAASGATTCPNLTSPYTRKILPLMHTRKLVQRHEMTCVSDCRKRHAVCRALDHCLSASPPPSLHPPAPSLCLTHCSAHKRWIPGGYEDEVSLLLQTHVYPVSREPVGSPLPPRHLPRRCLLCHRPSVLSASCRAFSPSTQLSFSGSACRRHLPCSPSSRQDAPVCARVCVRGCQRVCARVLA